jgi:hypothetical protein
MCVFVCVCMCAEPAHCCRALSVDTIPGLSNDALALARRSGRLQHLTLNNAYFFQEGPGIFDLVLQTRLNSLSFRWPTTGIFVAMLEGVCRLSEIPLYRLHFYNTDTAMQDGQPFDGLVASSSLSQVSCVNFSNAAAATTFCHLPYKWPLPVDYSSVAEGAPVSAESALVLARALADVPLNGRAVFVSWMGCRLSVALLSLLLLEGYRGSRIWSFVALRSEPHQSWKCYAPPSQSRKRTVVCSLRSRRSHTRMLSR